MSTASPTLLAILNARVFTRNPRRPWADAVLIRGDCIELVGSSAEVRKRIAATVRTIDARGMLVRPAAKDGVLEVGALADLVMLDRDNTLATPEQADDAQVMLTVIAGRVVFEFDRTAR